jgi:hypothetical protein
MTIPWACEVCKKCHLILKTGQCIYGGPYDGYDHAHAGNARKDGDDQCEEPYADTMLSGK